MTTRIRMLTSPVVLALALITTFGGAATATKLITGAQIANGTVHGRDLHDGSLTGADVTDGRVNPLDVHPDVRGAAGPGGTVGPAGATGLPGKHGVASLATRTASPVTVQAAGRTYIGVTCAGGQVLNGGVRSDASAWTAVLESAPTTTPNGWGAWVRNDGPVDIHVTVSAICEVDG